MKCNNRFFLVIGTYRSGTSWLQKVFMEHPQILVPPDKELFFFSRYYNRGEEWYNTFFKKKEQYSIYGEICPAYLRNAHLTADRIFNYCQKTKIVAILRNPIDQIESMIRLHRTRYGESKIIDLSEHEIINTYIQNVLYYNKLKPFIDNFSEKQMIILNYDELASAPINLLKKLYTFLGVDYFKPKQIGKINTAYKSKNITIDRLIASTGEFLRDNNFNYVIRLFNKLGIIKTLKMLNSSNDKHFLKLSYHQKEFIKDKLKEDYLMLDKITNNAFRYWLQ